MLSPSIQKAHSMLAKEAPKKPTSAAFEKLKQLSDTYKKKTPKKKETQQD